MVRSVILVSVLAFYLSLSAVDAQAPKGVSNESLNTLMEYLDKHPGSEDIKSAVAAVAESRKHKAEQAAEQPNPANNDNVTAEAAANGEGVAEQEKADEAAPAEEVAPAEEAAPAIEDTAAAAANDDPKAQENAAKEQDIYKANPAKDDKTKKADTKHEGALKSDVSVEQLKASLQKIRDSIAKSTKDSPVSESSAGARAASLPLAQTNQANALLANSPKDQGVILAGDATDHQGETNMNNSTGSLPSDSTIAQGAEPTNAPITNYDMSVTAGMSLTNGGSIMSAASASMSAPASSSSGTASASTKPSSSSSSGRPSATSTSAAHSGGNTNYNNYSLMFIGFTIFMSNMITIGFLW